jgi:hypothetical protein
MLSPAKHLILALSTPSNPVRLHHGSILFVDIILQLPFNLKALLKQYIQPKQPPKNKKKH